MSLVLSIPSKSWEIFEDNVLSTWFSTEEPILTRFTKLRSDGRECAVFCAAVIEDIEIVISMIPVNGVGIFVG